MITDSPQMFLNHLRGLCLKSYVQMWSNCLINISLLIQKNLSTSDAIATIMHLIL